MDTVDNLTEFYQIPLTKKNFLDNKVISEVRLIASLQNLKYNLKRFLTDQEISEKVLNMEFIQNLIQSHLSPVKNQSCEKLSRDPNSYIRFLEKTQNVKLESDHYINYFRKINAKDEVNRELFEKLQISLEAINDNENMNWTQKHGLKNKMINKYLKTRAALDEKNPEREVFYFSEYRTNLSRSTDTDSLQIEKFTIRDDPDYIRCENDQAFLEFKMRKAESNMIKLRILNKLHKNEDFSELEREYIKKWRIALNEATISDAGSVLVPKKRVMVNFSSIPEADRVFLNSFKNVNIVDSKVSINELVFELSNFFDDELISRVEFNIIERNRLLNWGIAPDANGESKLRPLWKNKSI